MSQRLCQCHVAAVRFCFSVFQEWSSPTHDELSVILCMLLLYQLYQAQAFPRKFRSFEKRCCTIEQVVDWGRNHNNLSVGDWYIGIYSRLPAAIRFASSPPRCATTSLRDKVHRLPPLGTPAPPRYVLFPFFALRRSGCVLPVAEQSLVAPHIDSYNFFLENGLSEAVKDLPPQVMQVRRKETR